METDPVFRDNNTILTSKWGLQTSVVPKFQMLRFSEVGRYSREYGIWHDALCLWIFGTTVFCSSKLAVFLELWFWKLFASRSRLCPRTNIIFWRQRYSITLVHFFTDLALSTSIGLHQTTLDISGSRNDLLCLFFLKRFSSWNSVRLSRTSCSFLKTRYWFRIPYYGA